MLRWFLLVPKYWTYRALQYVLLDKQRKVRGFIDNAYPCGIFQRKHLYDLNFRRVTILYGGNGSGKTKKLQSQHRNNQRKRHCGGVLVM